MITMRPERFEQFALRLAEASPESGSAMTLKQAGDSKHPYGLAVKLSGTEHRFQFVVQSADGDKYSEPERPVEGSPIDTAPTGGSAAEQWFAQLIAASASPEIADLAIWSTRPDSDRAGVTVTCHSGAKVFARVL
ncbi:hypothetical protein GCM10028832_09380 [Streptomyces sparsus]